MLPGFMLVALNTSSSEHTWLSTRVVANKPAHGQQCWRRCVPIVGEPLSNKAAHWQQCWNGRSDVLHRRYLITKSNHTQHHHGQR